MNDNNCPRCGTDNVYATNVYDRISLPTSGGNVLGVTAVVNQPVQTRQLLCARCGYLETYVVDRGFLDRLPQLGAWIKA